MTAADSLISQFEPYLVDDDGSLVTYLTACAAGREDVDSLVRDTDAGPGWSAILDPDQCPSWALRWLAQLVGIALAPGTPDATARAAIRTPSGWRRGTVQAMKDTVAQTLTSKDPASVFVLERQSGAWASTDNPYHFTVATYADDTPDTAATTAAAKTQKPAGLVMTVTQISRRTYFSVEDDFATYADAEAAFTTYATAEAG